jgi:hypothetical protein
MDAMMRMCVFSLSSFFDRARIFRTNPDVAQLWARFQPVRKPNPGADNRPVTFRIRMPAPAASC